MELCIQTIFFYLVIALGTILGALYAYFQHCYTYWSRRNIPYETPRFPFGNFGEQAMQITAPGDMAKKLYDNLKKKGHKFGGLYSVNSPVLFVLDPDLIKNIFAKDFQHFYARSKFEDAEHDPIPAHLFNLNGPKWKHLRAKLTPTFTSGKMKMMFQTMVDCGSSLNEMLDAYAQTGDAIDIKETMARFTTDIIGSCAFGLDMNSMNNPDAEFRVYGRKIFTQSLFSNLKGLVVRSYPALYKLLKIKRLPREIDDFFFNVVKETVEYREKNNIQRKDFLQLLIDMKNSGTTDENGAKITGLNIGQIAAQSFVFFVAGFETSSTTMGFCMYDLVKNPDIQDKLRKEINEVLKQNNGKLTYDAIMSMSYLDKVVNESLRLHPPVPILTRVCTQDYKIPDSDVTIEKGTTILISTFGLHTDEEYYPDSEKFNPERFATEEKSNRHPYVYMPFGEGPRNCIGLRFGLLQTKIGLSILLRNHKYTLSPKTKEPFEMDPRTFIYSVKGSIWVNAEKV